MSPESGINLDDDEQFWLSVDDTLETYRSSGEAQMTQYVPIRPFHLSILIDACV